MVGIAPFNLAKIACRFTFSSVMGEKFLKTAHRDREPMFIHSDDFDTSIAILLLLLVGVPLLLRIVAGRYSARKWGSSLSGLSSDPAPGFMKVIKGVLTLAVVGLPAMLFGPISSASGKLVVVVETRDADRLAFTRSHFMPEDAAFGMVGILTAIGGASATPLGMSGPVGHGGALPADLAEKINAAGKRPLVVNLSGKPLTHWRIAYAADGITPSPPIAAQIPPGGSFAAPSNRLQAGCIDPPPHVIRVQGDRDVWVLRRKVAVDGERFPTVGWFSWPGLGPCVADVLGVPAN